jgi:hypothetical protein
LLKCLATWMTFEEEFNNPSAADDELLLLVGMAMMPLLLDEELPLPWLWIA